jgi:D-beta-D-heptose 7-phosphate kinase/D-beta-D-heptose 1-phosphate adenosyltransferase
MKEKIVIVSGGFDPLHIGHVRYIQAARELGDMLVVILNNDHWLTEKKGRPFMNETARKAVMSELKSVHDVFASFHKKKPKDMSVCEEIKFLHDTFKEEYELHFAKGGDRIKGNVPEEELCKKLGIPIHYGVGGGKVESSSNLVKKAGGIKWQDL